MYRVGGMYVNVDLFIKQKALQFRIPWGLCRVISSYFHLIARYGCATLADALSRSWKVRIYKYFGIQNGSGLASVVATVASRRLLHG